jgi:hypothetical protein
MIQNQLVKKVELVLQRHTLNQSIGRRSNPNLLPPVCIVRSSKRLLMKPNQNREESGLVLAE